jgi:murein DD-endopeptidase MepM/ murein hydrolase activator NlpD
MKNILILILIIGSLSILFIQQNYRDKVEKLRIDNNHKIDSLLTEMDSLCNYIHLLHQYLDSLPLGSPLDTLIISSNYGWRKSPVFKVWRMHSGTDFLAAWNDTVYSTGHGTISKSGWNLGYGRQIRVLHCSGYESSYSHLYRLFVKVGDSVSLGDPIARAGNSGAVTGPHLHYEVIRDGKKSNPMEFIAARTSY